MRVHWHNFLTTHVRHRPPLQTEHTLLVTIELVWLRSFLHSLSTCTMVVRTSVWSICPTRRPVHGEAGGGEACGVAVAAGEPEGASSSGSPIGAPADALADMLADAPDGAPSCALSGADAVLVLPVLAGRPATMYMMPIPMAMPTVIADAMHEKSMMWGLIAVRALLTVVTRQCRP